ncbi:MAG: hypothetical protein MHPSP_000660, partial [Paramarteilia canceri]
EDYKLTANIKARVPDGTTASLLVVAMRPVVHAALLVLVASLFDSFVSCQSKLQITNRKIEGNCHFLDGGHLIVCYKKFWPG